jgi:hypothetical protein
MRTGGTASPGISSRGIGKSKLLVILTPLHSSEHSARSVRELLQDLIVKDASGPYANSHPWA